MASDLEPGVTVRQFFACDRPRRGLKTVDWRPSAGLNLIPGGGLTGGGRPVVMKVKDDIGVDYSKVILS